MKFHAPYLLWFLLLGLIPIIIHLFRFRRYRKVMFTRVDLLKQITIKSGLGNRLRKIVLMTLRVLGILSLVFAFALPFVPSRTAVANNPKNKLIVFLDNSLSMGGEGAEGVLFEAAKNRARMLVNDLSNEFSFFLVSHAQNQDFSKALDKDEMLQAIDKLSLTNSTLPEKDVLSILQSLTDNHSICAYISDFRKGFVKQLPENPELKGLFYWLNVPANQVENLAIDSAWFFSPQLQPEQMLKLMVKVTNYGKDNAKDVSLRLVENNAVKGVVNVNVEAGRSAIAEIPFNAGAEGWKNATLGLPGDDIHYDDQYFLSYLIQKGANGLIISDNGPSQYLKALFTEEAGFHVNFITPFQIVFDKLKEVDFIICHDLVNVSSGLADELNKFVNAGGALIVFPNAGVTQTTINQILERCQTNVYGNPVKQAISAELWNMNDPLLHGVFQNVPKNIDLPVIYEYNPILSNAGQLAFWKLKNGSPLAVRTKRGSGMVFSIAVPLDKAYSNLVTHPLFVPFILRIASFKETDANIAYETGKDEMLALKGLQLTKDAIWKLKNNKIELVPEIVMRDNHTYLLTHGIIQEPGIYSLTVNQNKEQYRFAFNLPRSESVSAVEDKETLKKKADEWGVKLLYEPAAYIANEIKKEGEGTPLWRYFIVFALLFLISEMILLRIWKV